MQLIDNRAVIVNTATPAAVTSVIPNSAVIGSQNNEHQVLVQWSLDNARVLHNLGFTNTPSPIRSQYNWPGRFTPFKHQRETAEFLTLNKRAFCLDEPGLGKSAACLWALDYLMHQQKITRVLIICPMSIMYSAWQDDAFSTVVHRQVGVAYGSREERKKIIASNAEIVVINYDGIKSVHKEILDGGFDLIICDECTQVKTATTQRWKAIHALIKPDTWVWLLSGTPVPQSPCDAYGIIKLIKPANVPKFFSAWQSMVMRQLNAFKWVPRHDAKDIVYNAMQPAIRHEKRDCLDLPPIMYETRDVEMTTQQKHFYERLKRDMVLSIGAKAQINAVNAGALMTKLLQTACGATLADDGKVVQFDISSRLAAIHEIIDEAQGKVLIAVPYLQPLFLLEKELSKSYSTELIYGDIPASARRDIFTKFQNQTDPQILLIQPSAAAHGVTLTEADTIIWYSPTTSFEIYAQFNARFDRVGQKRKMTVHLLQSCDAERKLNAALRVMNTNHVDLMALYKSIAI